MTFSFQHFDSKTLTRTFQLSGRESPRSPFLDSAVFHKRESEIFRGFRDFSVSLNLKSLLWTIIVVLCITIFWLTSLCDRYPIRSIQLSNRYNFGNQLVIQPFNSYYIKTRPHPRVFPSISLQELQCNQPITGENFNPTDQSDKSFYPTWQQTHVS